MLFLFCFLNRLNHVIKLKMLVNGLIDGKINMQILSLGLPAGFPVLFSMHAIHPILVTSSSRSCRTAWNAMGKNVSFSASWEATCGPGSCGKLCDSFGKKLPSCAWSKWGASARPGSCSAASFRAGLQDATGWVITSEAGQELRAPCRCPSLCCCSGPLLWITPFFDNREMRVLEVSIKWFTRLDALLTSLSSLLKSYKLDNGFCFRFSLSQQIKFWYKWCRMQTDLFLCYFSTNIHIFLPIISCNSFF